MNSLENSFPAKERLSNPFKLNNGQFNFEKEEECEISVVDFGVVGDGIQDDTEAFQRVLDLEKKVISVPKGSYRISKTLMISARTKLRLEDGARIVFAPQEGEKGMPIVANRIGECFADGITIFGGDWYDTDIFNDDEDRVEKESAFSFEGVKRLVLKQIRFHGVSRPFCRLFHANGYRILACSLYVDERKNDEIYKGFQGIILQGYCYFGEIAIRLETERCESAIQMLADDLRMSGKRGAKSGPIDGVIGSVDGCGKEAKIILCSEKSTLRAVRIQSETLYLRTQYNPNNTKGEEPLRNAFMDVQVGDSKIEGRKRECGEDEGRIIESCILAGPEKCYITSPFGRREKHPVTGEEKVFHKGVDVVAYDGQFLLEADICAWADGEVVGIGVDDGAGYFVVLNHGAGKVTRYFHLEQYSICVKQGQRVRKGEILGRMGNTGHSTGEHLHFQLEQDGCAISPFGKNG